MQPKSTSNERRAARERRIALQQAITLVTSDGHAFAADLKDLSRDGFRVEHVGIDLLVGEIVTIRTRRSEARAQIQWTRDGEAGGIFVDAASLDQPAAASDGAR